MKRFAKLFLITALIGSSAPLHAMIKRKREQYEAPMMSVEQANAQWARMLEESFSSPTPYLPKVQELIREGADIDMKNQFGETALHRAAGYNRDSIAHALLQAKADVNIPDNQGTTALMEATLSNNIDAVYLLLKARAWIEQEDIFGNTALIKAARGGNPEIVKILLEAGANPTHRNRKGKTAKDIALENGHQDIVRLLQSKKLD